VQAERAHPDYSTMKYQRLVDPEDTWGDTEEISVRFSDEEQNSVQFGLLSEGDQTWGALIGVTLHSFNVETDEVASDGEATTWDIGLFHRSYSPSRSTSYDLSMVSGVGTYDVAALADSPSYGKKESYQHFKLGAHGNFHPTPNTTLAAGFYLEGNAMGSVLDNLGGFAPFGGTNSSLSLTPSIRFQMSW